jgi:hypothetical protein
VPLPSVSILRSQHTLEVPVRTKRDPNGGDSTSEPKRASGPSSAGGADKEPVPGTCATGGWEIEEPSGRAACPMRPPSHTADNVHYVKFKVMSSQIETAMTHPLWNGARRASNLVCPELRPTVGGPTSADSSQAGNPGAPETTEDQLLGGGPSTTSLVNWGRRVQTGWRVLGIHTLDR